MNLILVALLTFPGIIAFIIAALVIAGVFSLTI